VSYNSNRISEQLRVLEPEINNFIYRFNASDGPADGSPRQTVFLFPGGMASRLVRAKRKWDPDGPAHQIFTYEEIWLNALTFLGRARELLLKRVGPNDYRDKKEQIIVADGLINLFGWTPYVDFTKWCALKGLDYFVFPCDWRRAAYDVGDLFIHHFLPRFQQLVKEGCNNADPLERFSLIGHSAGGLVVNWALRSEAPIMAGLDKAITVATPFYGYSGQLHRWFEGEQYLNGLGAFKKGIIKAICSFPGCYEWMFLPHEVFEWEEALLCADPDYPLCAYPSVDRTTPAIIADPYNPPANGNSRRYPTPENEGGFSLLELACAKCLVIHLASSLTQGQADKFWNIRGDTWAGDTLHDITWDLVPPTEPSPIRDVLSVPGDGVQPGWTARHVGLEPLAPGHVITLKNASAKHADLMDLPGTLDEIAGILGIPL
jgi:hypothetical protein